jgi:hypothetical protein
MRVKRQKEFEWTRLDNASKIFPATSNEKDTKVIRLTCELYEEVDPELLQRALDETMADFPLYRSVLRKGLFWYYLESSDIRPVVRQESEPVCAPIYVRRRNSLLFRVFYFHKRINLEIFHVLSDGTGAIWFLQSLACRYLILKHRELSPDLLADLRVSSVNKQTDDSFRRYFSGGGIFPRKDGGEAAEKRKKAYHIWGTRLPEKRIMLVEGAVSTKAVLAKAHEYHTTFTVLMASLLILSIYLEMPAFRKNRPIVLAVPINLRQFFESVTARNFFCNVNVGYDFKGNSPDFQDVVNEISASLQNNLTSTQLTCQLNRLMSLEQNLVARAIPLPVKDLVLRFAAKYSDRQITSLISNVGSITMPKEFDRMIRQFCVCTSVRRLRLTMCSYGDRTVVSFTSPFRETSIQRTFFDLLSDMGIEVEISSNF